MRPNIYHPSDAELEEYRDGMIRGGLSLTIKQHLDLCSICERRLEYLKEEAAAMAAARQGYRAPPAQGQVTAFSVRQEIRPAAATPVDGETEDGKLRWLIRDDRGSLKVNISGDRLLDGRRLRLSIGSWHAEVRLKQELSGSRPVARVTITPAEQRGFGASLNLRIEEISEQS